jgi:hypothetical protein
MKFFCFAKILRHSDDHNNPHIENNKVGFACCMKPAKNLLQSVQNLICYNKCKSMVEPDLDKWQYLRGKI